MYQHNGKQRYVEGNNGQHEMRSEQVKSLLPGTQQPFGCGLITRRSQVQILPPPPIEEYAGQRSFPAIRKGPRCCPWTLRVLVMERPADGHVLTFVQVRADAERLGIVVGDLRVVGSFVVLVAGGLSRWSDL